MRLRVEELALAADVSVDTVRYYQKQRLLPPPERDGRLAWYAAEHLERLGRIKELHFENATIALAGRVVLLDRGRAVAEGTHESLLASNERYRHVLAQADAAEEGDSEHPSGAEERSAEDKASMDSSAQPPKAAAR